MPLPSEIYDRAYFLSDRCEGLSQYRQGGLSAIKRTQVDLLAPGPNMRVLDAGCGRGELLRECAGMGAAVAGIDYSRAAVELARETLAGIEGADVRKGDVTDLPWPESSFDRVMFGDVIEHLDPDQASASLTQMRRVLKPGGRLVVHTAPNRLFLDVGWPVARVALRAAGRGDLAARTDAWIAESKRYHVNEQSARSLRRGLREAGFQDVRAWVDPNVARQGHGHHLTGDLTDTRIGRAGSWVASRSPLRTILGNDVYALGRA